MTTIRAKLIATGAATGLLLSGLAMVAASPASAADPIPYTPATTQHTPFTATADGPGELKTEHRVDIAQSEDGFYRQYRIPGMIVTNDGTIVTTYDGRRTVADLPSHIDNVVRISHDGGATWDDQVVGRAGAYPRGYGDPALGYNPDTGRIFRFYTGSVSTGFASGKAGTDPDDPGVTQNLMSYSDDNGKTWKDTNITVGTKDPLWSGMFASSGTSTYIETGKYKGRLVQQYTARTPDSTGIVSAWSDDNGKTWQHGAPAALGIGNENKVVSTSSGDLLLNLRGGGNRYRAISTDGGATWGPATKDPQLVDPNDNGAIVRVYPSAPASDPKSKIMLSSNNDDNAIRMNTTIRMSCDDGQTWPIAKVLEKGASAYSTIVMQNSDTAAVLYERDGYKNITFASFKLSELGGLCAPISLTGTPTLTAGTTGTIAVTIANQEQRDLPAGQLAITGPFVSGSVAVPAITKGASTTVTLPAAADAQAPAATEPATLSYTAGAASSGLATNVQLKRASAGDLTTVFHDQTAHQLDGTSLVDVTDQLNKVKGATAGSISVKFKTGQTTSPGGLSPLMTLFAVNKSTVDDHDLLLTVNYSSGAKPYYEIRASRASGYAAKCQTNVIVSDNQWHTATLTAMNGSTTYALDGTVLCTASGQHFFGDVPNIDNMTIGGVKFQKSTQNAPTDQWFFTGTIADVEVKTVAATQSAPTPQPAVLIEPILDVYKYNATPGLGAGDQGSYMVRVTNTGNVALTGLSATSNIDLAGCIAGTLEPAASLLCRNKTHTFTQADVDAGAFTPGVTVNATASGSPFAATANGVAVPLPAPFTLPDAPAAATAPTGGCAPTAVKPVAAIANTEESLASGGREDSPATNAIDGDPNTFWSSGWSVGTEDFPNWIIVDLGKSTNVCGFAYQPRQSNTNGNIGDWRAYVGDDPNKLGDPVAGGSFVSGNATQTAYFGAPVKGRYLKLAAYNDIGAAHTDTTTIAELSVRAVDPNYVAPTGDPALIPAPASVQQKNGPKFGMTASTAIVVDDTTQATGEYLAGLLKPATGFDLKVVRSAPAGANAITLRTSANAGTGGEAYTLDVGGDGVTINGTTAEAVFDAVQTLRQLFPAAIASTTVQPGAWTIAPISIADAPRYDYRSGMLDVGRRFYPVDQVERFIDYLAQYKFNALHLHLTEDQGWRIAIDAYPALTQVGASVQSGIPAGTVDNGVPGPWFYSKADYQRILDYAASRYVTVVPEIDGPGHAGAAMSAVANLNCNDTTIAPWTNFNRGPNFCLDDAHIGNVKTFLTTVISDLAAQTRGEFIHVGGDESAGITAQQYTAYTTFANQAVAAAGKKVMAWNSWEDGAGLPAGGVLDNYAQESGDPGLAANVKKAVNAGNKILMSPADHAYLDIKYDKTTKYGLTWINGGYIDLARAYKWEPTTAVPDGSGKLALNDSQIFGVEFALWADATNQNGTTTPWSADKPFDPVSKYMDTMLFPRLPAIAEIAWSPKADRQNDAALFDDFQARLVNQAQAWDAAGIGYNRASDVRWKSVGAPALPAATDVTVDTPTAKITIDDGGAAHFVIAGTVGGTVKSVQATIAGVTHELDAGGDYSLSVPAVPGDNAAELRVVDAAGAQVGGPLTVHASLGSLTAERVTEGWKVSGSQLAPNTDVALSLHSDPIALGTAHTDATGSFTATVAIPASATAGQHTIVAVAGTSAAATAVTVDGAPGEVTVPAQTPGGGGPAAAGPSAGAGSLPGTGSDILGALWLAAVLLAAGCAVAVRARGMRAQRKA